MKALSVSSRLVACRTTYASDGYLPKRPKAPRSPLLVHKQHLLQPLRQKQTRGRTSILCRNAEQDARRDGTKVCHVATLFFDCRVFEGMQWALIIERRTVQIDKSGGSPA